MADKVKESVGEAWVSWDSSYELGIPMVDEQHKKLVALCDRFHQELLAVRGNADGPSWKEALSGALRETAQYANTHFTQEEELMQAAGYVNFEFHRSCHKEFIDAVTDILNSFQKVTLQTSMEFAAYLKNWVLFHIAYEDQHFSKCVKEYLQQRE